MNEVKMRGPKGCADTLHHGGKVHSADRRGVFSVPEDAVEALQRHGFHVVEDKPEKAEK